jgi:hypothetical protein
LVLTQVRVDAQDQLGVDVLHQKARLRDGVALLVRLNVGRLDGEERKRSQRHSDDGGARIACDVEQEVAAFMQSQARAPRLTAATRSR